MAKTVSIYRYYNIRSGKSYIGQTVRKFNTRHLQHLREAVRQREKYSAFQSALRKYSEEDWIRGVIVTDVPRFMADAFEKYWINYYSSYSTGYNLTLGGQGTQGCSSRKGKKHTTASKLLISLNNGSYKGQPAPYIHTKAQKAEAAVKSKGNNSRASVTSWSLQFPGETMPTIYTGYSKKKYAEENGYNYKAFRSLFSNGVIPSRGAFKGVIALIL